MSEDEQAPEAAAPETPAPEQPAPAAISAEVFAQLPEAAKALFSNGGDGYTFTPPAPPPVLGDAGKAALKAEREAAATARRELGALKSQLEKAEEEALSAQGKEVEAKQKRIDALERLVAENEAKLGEATTMLTKATGHDMVRRTIHAFPEYDSANHGALDAAIERFVGSQAGQPAILDSEGKVAFDDATGKEMIGEQWIKPWFESLPSIGFKVIKGDVGTQLAGKRPGSQPLGKSFSQLTEAERRSAYAALEAELGEKGAMTKWAQIKAAAKAEKG